MGRSRSRCPHHGRSAGCGCGAYCRRDRTWGRPRPPKPWRPDGAPRWRRKARRCHTRSQGHQHWAHLGCSSFGSSSLVLGALIARAAHLCARRGRRGVMRLYTRGYVLVKQAQRRALQAVRGQRWHPGPAAIAGGWLSVTDASSTGVSSMTACITGASPKPVGAAGWLTAQARNRAPWGISINDTSGWPGRPKAR